jgi:predicted nuclease of predicted toxin-antitoxin system
MVLRFHLDENVDPAVADGLRLRGGDITTAADATLTGAEDSEQFRFALSQGRVIVTHDDDFLKIAAAGGAHAGIVYCRPQKKSVGEIVRYLEPMAACLTPDEMVGKIEFM